MAAARHALITGGHGALAQALAAELQAAGYHVLAPGHAELDVCSADSVSAYFNQLGKLDLLINNAGVRHDALLVRMTTEAWNHVLQTNLHGAHRCAQAALRLMRPQRAGHIMNIGSHSARIGPIGQANYATAKSALIGLTQVLARQEGPQNIRVNCVLPGWLETNFTAQLPPAVQAAALAAHCLGRFNTVADAARAIAFLDSLPHLSGQVIALDSRVPG